MVTVQDIAWYIKRGFAKFISFCKKAWPIVKKLLDPVDDVIAALRAVLDATGKLISILIAACGGFLHLIEFFSAAKILFKQIKNKAFHYATTTFTSLNLVLSGSGVGLAITLLIGTLTTLPVAALAMTLAPFLLPALMMVIFVNKYIQNKLLLNDLEIEMEELNSKPDPTPDEQNKLKNADFILHKKQCSITFNKLEIFATSVVLAGIVTGIAPLTFLGVGIGLTIKIIEAVNKKTDYAFSRWMVKLFTKKTINVPHDENNNATPSKFITTQPVAQPENVVLSNTNNIEPLAKPATSPASNIIHLQSHFLSPEKKEISEEKLLKENSVASTQEVVVMNEQEKPPVKEKSPPKEEERITPFEIPGIVTPVLSFERPKSTLADSEKKSVSGLLQHSLLSNSNTAATFTTPEQPQNSKLHGYFVPFKMEDDLIKKTNSTRK